MVFKAHCTHHTSERIVHWIISLQFCRLRAQNVLRQMPMEHIEFRVLHRIEQGFHLWRLSCSTGNPTNVAGGCLNMVPNPSRGDWDVDRFEVCIGTECNPVRPYSRPTIDFVVYEAWSGGQLILGNSQL